MVNLELGRASAAQAFRRQVSFYPLVVAQRGAETCCNRFNFAVSAHAFIIASMGYALPKHGIRIFGVYFHHFVMRCLSAIYDSGLVSEKMGNGRVYVI